MRLSMWIHFSDSLHHVKGMDEYLKTVVKPLLKSDGLLVIHEFVGPDRMNFPKHQMQAINKALAIIPETHRRVYKTSFNKNKVYKPGWLRTVLADPSECVESSQIRPLVKKHFSVVEEKEMGGNLLMLLLKDIAYHFETLTAENQALLQQLYALEDDYLKDHLSDFLFGVYRNV